MNFIKRNRKRIILVSASIITLFAIIISVISINIHGFTEYETRLTINEEKHELSFNSDNVKILQLSDVQTKNLIECSFAYPTVKAVVKEAAPDLIVLTGDNISDGSGKLVLNTFIDFMDSFGIPWAPIFGNHDRNTDLSMAEICEALEKSKNCIFKTGKLGDRYGNYSYDLITEDGAVYSLIFMDSEKSNFTEEQVEWYKHTIEQTNIKHSKTVPSMVFYHIPIQETRNAHEAYDKDKTIGSGVQRDEVRVQDANTGFFDAVKELGSTTALFYGHDHENNTMITYEDVLFCYAMKSGITVYFDKDSLGGNLITINKDSTFSVERIYYRII